MMLCTAMVCLMTPGLAFFYGGLARKRSVLYIMMQSFISMGIVTLIWIYGGFGLAFGKDEGGVIGRISDYFALVHVGLVPNSVHAASIPFALFFLFQLMFCVITVPLISGAFAERLNMKGYILLLIFWTYLVYIPVCHWVWGNGFLAKWGFVDFAGGTVIHTTAGFAALASIIVLGKRKLKQAGMKPSNLMAAAIGTGLLWFGWFGFNSGGALRAGALATKAFTNTIIGLASGMIVWILYAKFVRGKFDFIDVLTGSVAGLATITPCAGYINPASAVLVGLAAGIICNIAVSLQEKIGWDDALGVWGVHGIGGFTGTILIGILADRTVNGIGASGHQFLIQAGGVILVAAYSFAITFILLKILGAITNIRPSDKIIQEGLDQTLLNETTYDID
ncbi:ammonium transporter [Limosilactobacillus agrestis]|nr:ammonium transporter [Limosilactobacillus agrestis]MCD7112361.1 ammonium transporter [Limosilactobacillus agrestis]MCD7119536.1 ammonium transporter [Limosilactobacillus agrestis]MCD7126548.1 ammonium transporter [Limosilactobacillus agrestis]MCD7130322.1 ammonium transporter [Limosilactobacillus agrestis]